jgi:flagellar protein FliO/FliZ
MIVLRLIPLALLPLASSVFAAASATVATVTPAMAGSSPSPAGSLFQVLLGLVAVLALMALCAWLLRRFNASKTSGNTTIRIIGGVSVGTRERVMVVEVADQWIVVGVAPGRVTQLSTMPKQEAVASTDTPTRNFSSWLAQTLEKRNAQ